MEALSVQVSTFMWAVGLTVGLTTMFVSLLMRSMFETQDARIEGMFGILGSGFSDVKTRLSGVETGLSEVKTELAGVKTELSGVKTEQAEVKVRLSGLETGQAGLQAKQEALTETVTTLRVEVGKLQVSPYRPPDPGADRERPLPPDDSAGGGSRGQSSLAAAALSDPRP
ncbi:MAG: hypothetical protein LBQ79_10380 [Deltaproteobacteria bacterium]|jgi:hypothetical protein|nr:hypothetical protein [Deltaproteobacteria bacterium]